MRLLHPCGKINTKTADMTTYQVRFLTCSPSLCLSLIHYFDFCVWPFLLFRFLLLLRPLSNLSICEPCFSGVLISCCYEMLIAPML